MVHSQKGHVKTKHKGRPLKEHFFRMFHFRRCEMQAPVGVFPQVSLRILCNGKRVLVVKSESGFPDGTSSRKLSVDRYPPSEAQSPFAIGVAHLNCPYSRFTEKLV